MTTKRLAPRDAIDTGLIHEINERVLWPLGLALTAMIGERQSALFIAIHDDTIVSGLTPEQHRQRHAAFERFAGQRASAVAAAAKGPDTPAPASPPVSGRPRAAGGTKKAPSPKARGRAGR